GARASGAPRAPAAPPERLTTLPSRPPVPVTAPGASSVPDDGGLFSGVTDFAISLMETLGGPGVAIAIALENLFPPIPSEVVLPLAGFTASQGDLSLVGVILWTVAGSLVGALLLYGLGAGLGIHRLRAIADRLPLVDAHDIDDTERWFARHGPKAVFFGRMLPIDRKSTRLNSSHVKSSYAVFCL